MTLENVSLCTCLLSLSLLSELSNAARINNAKQVHQTLFEEESNEPIPKPILPIAAIGSALERIGSPRFGSPRFGPPQIGSALDDVRGDLEKTLAAHNDFARLIVVPGSAFGPRGKVNLDNINVDLDGEVLREQAVDLLISQSAMSGLPGDEEKLREGLMNASRIVVVLRKEKHVWVVKALAAMKANTWSDGKACEAGYIVVDPQLQGKKVGTLLWRALIVVAKEMNVEAFYTETMLSNVASLKLQRHNCEEVRVVGLFTEESACPRYPKRQDLQLLVMLFPLISTSGSQLRLHGIVANIRGMYERMKEKGSIKTWHENTAMDNTKFLDYQEVLAAVYRDPTLDEVWNQKRVKHDKKTIDEWKTEVASSISKELGVDIPPKDHEYAAATAELQIRSLSQPTPMRQSEAKRWNSKVIVIGGVSLVVMNCVLLGHAFYVRVFPRSDYDEDVAMKNGNTESSETIART